MTLFADDEIPAVPKLGKEAQRERLIAAYAAELLEHPPVSSLKPEVEYREEVRKRTARTLAAKDVDRLLRVIPLADFQLADRGTVARLKATLSDMITAARSGTVDQALVERAVKAIQPCLKHPP